MRASFTPVFKAGLHPSLHQRLFLGTILVETYM